MGKGTGSLHLHSQLRSVSEFATEIGVAAVLAVMAAVTPARAIDVNDKLSINGVAAAAVQCQEIDGAGGRDECRGGLSFQPEVSVNDEGDNSLFFKFGFGGDNGLNPVSPFALAPWAVDLEDDVKDLNGRGRDHVLSAWYRRRFHFAGDGTLAFTGGLIDSTDYLDDNAFANDEYAQFMNEALVNAPTAFLPSYDWGGVVELERGPWSARAVTMRVGANDDGNGYTFYGGQIAFTSTTALGEGTYRIVAAGTSDEFLDPTGANREGLRQFTVSADQELGKTFGVFVRLGRQNDAAAVTHSRLYSGGVNIKGGIWGRPDDNIGIGYARLKGGNGEVRESRVTEFYYRLVINEHWALTGDAQWLEDQIVGAPDIEGSIFSLRATKEF